MCNFCIVDFHGFRAGGVSRWLDIELGAGKTLCTMRIFLCDVCYVSLPPDMLAVFIFPVLLKGMHLHS